ncbi:TadE family protein [Aquisediminimonas profunda]|uniref:TadE family protein n=1 Tax=Aquisediminimonas profunda TaxID=1550733 RepID=UPI001C62C04B|nr:TadE family protein [Aquisediminimonas profunda]
MFWRILHDLRSARSGVAAAEMALVTPFLLVMMFAVSETGYYFYSQHVVVTAVRDGARYASRLSFTNYPCPSGSIPGGTVTNIKNVTMTGALSGGVQRLAGWSNLSTITVEMACGTTELTGTDKGIYTGLTGGVPVVTVTATVPYKALFSQVGLSNSPSLVLSASSQIPVMGI